MPYGAVSITLSITRVTSSDVSNAFWETLEMLERVDCHLAWTYSYQ